ncbi:chemotaxis protein CheA [Herminiimonas sp. CN]|uniref:chemotaxis protein CheA n=1 Tax=Herminiimonas sp. CN TaxID=1349818 RepID=UPI0004735FB6|nr:chemotaxis protein CheA [Herminiimonas sp. CN]
MDDMLKEFVVEALELATNVEEHLLVLERQPDDQNTLNALFRSFHTIKGGAGFMNLTAMVSACHLTENLFDALRTGAAPVTPIAIEAALQASGFVADQLGELANGTAAEQLAAMPDALQAILTAAIDGNAQLAPPAVVAAVVPNLAGQPDWDAYYHALIPAHVLPSTAPAITPTSAPALASAAVATSATVTKTEKTPPGTPAAKSTAPVIEDSIRIDAVKLDTLLEVAGESVQAANQAAVLLEKLAQFKFEGDATTLVATLTETIERASRYSTELQRATLATRMQPVGRLFQRFPRLIRELAKDLGKEVELAIKGAETEVDRVVVDSLYDPLVHMLRNSLDHGVESQEDRIKVGKPPKSTISLTAWQEASSVMIEVADDGKGMNAQFLREKARTKGLIGENDAQTDEEAFQLVFLPGFSTKEVATAVSGRGVGMDVVKTAVDKHRGTIRIDSRLGQGTRFLIRLPIELSIVPTMLVRTSGAALAMPLAVIERVVELPETFSEVGGAPTLRDQGRPLLVRSLAEILGYEACVERVGIVIAAPQPYILAMEAVEGTADLVIKPLSCLNVPGITGTARSAEGELVLVIGLSYLLDSCRTGARVTA